MRIETRVFAALDPDGEADPIPLLQIYESVVKAADRLGPVARFGPSRRDPARADILPRRSWGWATHRQPAVRVLLRAMIHHHIRRRLGALKAIYDRRAAAASADDERKVEQGHAERVEQFRGSLPAPPTRRLVLAFMLAVFALVVAIALRLPAPLRDSVLQVVDRLLVLMDEFGWASARAAAQETLEGSSVGLVLAAFLAVPAVCIVGQLPLCAFRLKRALLNLSPGPLAKLPHTPRRSHVRRSTGAYLEEARLFAALDSRMPAERPWDLTPRLVGFVLVFLLVWPSLDLTFDRPFGLFDLFVNAIAWGGLAWSVVATVRIGWRRRHPSDRGPLVSPAWMGDALTPGILRLEGSKLSFRDGPGALVFDRQWWEFRVVHVARDHSFGQGLVLRTADRLDYHVALMDPELARLLKRAKAWAVAAFVLLSLALVAPNPLVRWVSGVLAAFTVVRRSRVLVGRRDELWRATCAISSWRSALDAWP